MRFRPDGRDYLECTEYWVNVQEFSNQYYCVGEIAHLISLTAIQCRRTALSKGHGFNPPHGAEYFCPEKHGYAFNCRVNRLK